MVSLTRSESRYTPWLHCVFLFAFSWSLRKLFFQGLVLGDNLKEYQYIRSVAEGHLSFTDQFHFRLFVWLFNALVQRVAGTSICSFFLPIQWISASLAPIGYSILCCSGYRRAQALLAGLFVASAPFEVMLGTVWTNDLFLEWFLALSVLVLVLRTDRAFLRGCLLGVLMWCAFYVKLWACYFLLVIGAYYIERVVQRREFRGVVGFVLVSVLLHTAIILYWKMKAGFYFPFLHLMPGDYPVGRPQLAWLFSLYPRMLFQGSEFGTTLFGIVPCLFLVLILLKGTLAARGRVRFDQLDWILLLYSVGFFLLLNFVSTSLDFSQYYSPGRIFRYLAPISFPLALHTGKLLLDVEAAAMGFIKKFLRRTVFIESSRLTIFCALVVCNVFQAAAATGPGRAYWSSVLETLHVIQEQKPPRIVCESWLAFVFSEVFRREIPSGTQVTTVDQVDTAQRYEKWLHENESRWEAGTILITGLSSYVHYGCHPCGMRLRYFAQGLGPEWSLYREVGMLDFLPRPEPALLWVFQPSSASPQLSRRS